MSDATDLVYKTIDEQNAGASAATRRQLMGAAAATIGGLGMLGLVDSAAAKPSARARAANFPTDNTPENILTVAATAEVLATIVNTVGWERGLGGDRKTQRNIKAAAGEELIHYRVLTETLGAKPVTKKIWVPDAVFSNRKAFLSTLEVGDQIFCNAYLIGVAAFGYAALGLQATVAAEFMGVEAVHRALARQSLGKLGNDRVFIKSDRVETAPGAPNRGQPGFENIFGAVEQLQGAGFGFGAKGATPGRYFEFDKVSERTPFDRDLNTTTPDPVG